MENEKKQKIKETAATVGGFFSTMITAFVAMLAVILVVAQVTGFKFLTVASSSMEPVYPVNTLVLVKPVDPAEIEENDVITYVLNADLTLVTHRVVEIDADSQVFYTKGDANNTRDPNPVLWGNTVGKVVLGIPYIGAPVSYITDAQNRPQVIAALVIIGVLSLVWDVITRKTKKNIKEKRRVSESVVDFEPDETPKSR